MVGAVSAVTNALALQYVGHAVEYLLRHQSPSPYGSVIRDLALISIPSVPLMWLLAYRFQRDRYE
jgi:hypothetical protein